MTVTLDGETLTPEAVVAVARAGERVTVADDARDRLRRARDRVERVLESGEAVYGLNTGFGDLVDRRIPLEDVEALQTNLLRSHAAGVGEELPREVVRATMLTRANALLTGHSGVREAVVDHLVAMLNGGVHPVVPSRGSLGASGDLAPLAHLSLVLIGEGEAVLGPPGSDATASGDVDRESGSSSSEPRRLPGAAALESIGLEPLSLAPKEGLALVNGTQVTLALASLLVVDGEALVRAADVAGALTTEVTFGTTASSDPAIHAVRPHAGQRRSAEHVRDLTAGSEVVEAHRNCDRVQDAYSLRCLPQVHGAVRDALAHLREAVAVELNSATDNPLVFAADAVDDRASGADAGAGVLSGGNFHGEPLALRLEYARIALTELAAIAERRIDRLLNPNLQEPHLPAFLTEESGVESGYMLAQYTAAALLNECRATGAAATDNTPVSGGQEDHVSMSAQSALNARRTLENVRLVLAAELCCGAQAAEFVADAPEVADREEPPALGAGTGAAHECVRDVVPPLSNDRPIHDDLEAVAALLSSGRLLEAVDARLAS